MPKRTDIEKIIIIGSGPIIIGQACEFDYSGTQACKTLMDEGYHVILVNSNPATIMTDTKIAHRTYIEPVSFEIVSKIIEKERPDAILPTLGGQTGLNIIMKLYSNGIIEKFNVEIIGTSIESIKKAESRDLFKKSMHNIGLRVAKSETANTIEMAINIAKTIGFPIIIRPSFTMGGTGCGITNNFNSLYKTVKKAIKLSPIGQIILEESLVGWKEYELEIMRDSADNSIIICSIENIDPIGIHTGDSITVAPIQTLTDKEYQIMRNAGINAIKEIGINSGGSNIQFATHPNTGEIIVIEVNPRVSRSSALASKATGFPIAKIAAKLAINYTLDEIANDVTGKTKACFEPILDYCVIKIPVWDFDKFQEIDDILSISMKSVGETMAIGRTFIDTFQKAIRSLGLDLFGFGSFQTKTLNLYNPPTKLKEIKKKLNTPNSKRIFDLYYAFQFNLSINEINKITGIDPWFLFQFKHIFETEKNLSSIASKKSNNLKKNIFIQAKKMGFSDIQIANITKTSETHINQYRKTMNIKPVYKAVDTCASEFSANTPYYYSSYETECEIKPTKKNKKIIILGSGPNRIGQGIEFDYCCVQASITLRKEGIKSIVINSNPATVSTDYDISDKLYFEPLTYEDIVNIIDKEKPNGIITQFGGQIPINLSILLQKIKIPILGTQIKNIYRSEDRGLFQNMLKTLGIMYPNGKIVQSITEALKAAELIGYPVIVRPSFIIGGKAMKIIYTPKELKKITSTSLSIYHNHSIIIDKFLQNSIEIDVDAISDGTTTIICGIMEQIEQAGIHSGDSACVLPTQSIKNNMINEIKNTTKTISSELNIVGLINIQYAIHNNLLYILEVNPRASRTVPFVSKSTGIPMVKIATQIMLGKKLNQIDLISKKQPKHVSVKEAIFPFNKLHSSNVFLGPEMKSTGEVMGIGQNFESAYAKSQFAAGQDLPLSGTILINIFSLHKKKILNLIKNFKILGFNLLIITNNKKIPKHGNMSQNHFNIIKALKTRKIQLILITNNIKSNYCRHKIHEISLQLGIPYITTISAAIATYNTIKYLLDNKKIHITTLQKYHF